jgi:hypothetical protein
MTNATQPAVAVDSEVEPAVVLTNKTLLLLDQQFPDSEVQGMPDDALDSADSEQK